MRRERRERRDWSRRRPPPPFILGRPPRVLFRTVGLPTRGAGPGGVYSRRRVCLRHRFRLSFPSRSKVLSIFFDFVWCGWLSCEANLIIKKRAVFFSFLVISSKPDDCTFRWMIKYMARSLRTIDLEWRKTIEKAFFKNWYIFRFRRLICACRFLRPFKSLIKLK